MRALLATLTLAACGGGSTTSSSAGTTFNDPATLSSSVKTQLNQSGKEGIANSVSCASPSGGWSTCTVAFAGGGSGTYHVQVASDGSAWHMVGYENDSFGATE